MDAFRLLSATAIAVAIIFLVSFMLHCPRVVVRHRASTMRRRRRAGWKFLRASVSCRNEEPQERHLPLSQRNTISKTSAKERANAPRKRPAFSSYPSHHHSNARNRGNTRFHHPHGERMCRITNQSGVPLPCMGIPQPSKLFCSLTFRPRVSSELTRGFFLLFFVITNYDDKSRNAKYQNCYSVALLNCCRDFL